MDVDYDGRDGVSQKKSDMTAGGFTKRCSIYWLQMDFHQKGGIFRARWSEVQGWAGSQKIFIERKN